MTFLTRDGRQMFATVIVRPVGDTLVREITFPYNTEVPMETTTVDVAGLTDWDRGQKLMEVIHEVAPRDTAVWLGRAWKAELSWTTLK